MSLVIAIKERSQHSSKFSISTESICRLRQFLRELTKKVLRN